MARNRWTEAQLQLLRDHYADTPLQTLADALGRPLSAIYKQAYTLKLNRSAEAWNAGRQQPGALYEALHAALVAAGSKGCDLPSLLALAPDQPRSRVSATLYRMTLKARAHQVGDGRNPGARWFAEAEPAAAWHRASPGLAAGLRPAREKPAAAAPAAVQRGLSDHRLRRRELDSPSSSPPRRGPAALADIEPVRTERTREFIAPRPPDHRYVHTTPVEGGFRTAGIGNYGEPCRPWAAAAAASRGGAPC